MQKKQLIDTLAKICYYGQEHSRDWDFHERRELVQHIAFEHISHVVSCFVSQNTKYGNEGVESSVVLDKLTERQYSLKEWETIIEDIVQQWNTDLVKQSLK